MPLLGVFRYSCRNLPKSFAELFGEQRERVEPPGEVDVAGEKDGCLPHSRQVASEQDELVDRASERLPTALAEEVDCDRLDSTIVDPELAPVIAARSEEQA